MPNGGAPGRYALGQFGEAGEHPGRCAHYLKNGSITAARTQRQQQHRQSDIATVLHRKTRSAVDEDTATIAVAVYDLDRIADRLAATADYQTLTALIAADLQLHRINPHPGAKYTDHEPTPLSRTTT